MQPTAISTKMLSMNTYSVYLIAYKNRRFKTLVDATSITIAGKIALNKALKKLPNIDWQISMIWYNWR